MHQYFINSVSPPFHHTSQSFDQRLNSTLKGSDDLSSNISHLKKQISYVTRNIFQIYVLFSILCTSIVLNSHSLQGSSLDCLELVSNAGGQAACNADMTFFKLCECVNCRGVNCILIQLTIIYTCKMFIVPLLISQLQAWNFCKALVFAHNYEHYELFHCLIYQVYNILGELSLYVTHFYLLPKFAWPVNTNFRNYYSH